MSIWMDMTNSMHVWQGGVVGIVRAELEIAKNMREYNPNIRFVKYNGHSFVEIPSQELNWLWETDSVGDAYLTHMGRKQTSGTDTPQVSIEALRKAYPGLENAYRYSDSHLHRVVWGLLLYADTLPAGLRGFTKGCINIATAPLKKLSLWRAHRKARATVNHSNKATDSKTFSHPFQEGDLVFSCGWMYSGKEEGFERVKQELPSLFLTYLVYDIILIRENTKQFYAENLSHDFETYIKWISMFCDSILYGGKTAMEDTQAYQKKKKLPIPFGYTIYFGSNIIQPNESASFEFEKYCKENGIVRNYILAVGSMDERKNYSTLYRAMTILADNQQENAFPQLVIVGKGGACQVLRDTIERDPRTQNNIIFLAPTDEELHQLYQHTCFVVLASVWEGWSLTLPEALQYNKMILASDVAPLREAGGEFAVYVDPYDPMEWAAKILYYYQHIDERKQIEKNISQNYKAITWNDCGKQIVKILDELSLKTNMKPEHNIYVDLSLACEVVIHLGKITGILRSQLMLAKYMYQLSPDIKFIAFLTPKYGIEISPSILSPLLFGDSLDADFEKCKADILRTCIPASQNQTKAQPSDKLQVLRCKEDACWFLISACPRSWQPKLIEYAKKKKRQIHQEAMTAKESHHEPDLMKVPLQKNDILFSAGVGFGDNINQKMLSAKQKIGFHYVCIVYDFTPILLPQVHQKATIDAYIPFLDFTSKCADMILYGGATAQHDGIAYQKKMGLPIPRSFPIKFGSNISEKQAEDEDTKLLNEKEKEQKVKKTLKDLGIKGPYVLSVGTMEIRKNYETLYRTYVRMMDTYKDLPQMVFAGHRGWKTEEFLGLFYRDDRVKGKVIWLTPSDEELEILYQNCEFTILASLYEGWSLTLPESYWYGKFCLCCDTPALKETAGELAEYVQAWDEKKWAERIYYYHTHPEAIQKREHAIATQWHAISWEECAQHILNHLKELSDYES